MFEKPIVMIDFETSGMSPEQGGRVTEVAALRIVGGEIADRFVSLINCDVHIPYYITELTGITQQMVDNAPPVSEVIPELVQFIGSDTLAAHNASFDEKFLKSESDRLGVWPTYDGVVCSVKLARRIFPGLSSYSLGKLASSLGIRFQGAAHRAEADAEVASHVLLHAATHLRDQYGIQKIDPQLLIEINKRSAAKVAPFLKTWTSPPVEKMTSRDKINAPQTFRHYKGGMYELICEATQESDLTPVIVYRSHDGSVWTRPKPNFFETITVDGVTVKRFTPIN
ncbi:DUF1653 domain-containing protein [Undibacterium sp. RuRC25W]|uniref:DUF1653 domain-containing protein n=1 Tax=Undibacterium sp. RuRC25W TaxID=3413047 RepID=UPI003BF2A2B3